MKGILNNLIFALNNLTAAISKKNNTYVVNPTTTSNPYYTSPNLKVTSYYQSNNSSVHISKQEYDAFKAIYEVFTNKGSFPEHYDHVTREIKVKWPALDAALNQVVKSYNNKITEL